MDNGLQVNNTYHCLIHLRGMIGSATFLYSFPFPCLCLAVVWEVGEVEGDTRLARETAVEEEEGQGRSKSLHVWVWVRAVVQEEEHRVQVRVVEEGEEGRPRVRVRAVEEGRQLLQDRIKGVHVEHDNNIMNCCRLPLPSPARFSAIITGPKRFLGSMLSTSILLAIWSIMISLPEWND